MKRNQRIEKTEENKRIKHLENLLCSSRHVASDGGVSCLGEMLDCPVDDCDACMYGKIADEINAIISRKSEVK